MTPYRKTCLDNGLRILTQEMPHTYSVSAALLCGAGSRHESGDLAGISHIVEHMLFKGTPRRPTAKEVAEAIEEVGGMMNAGTEKEITSYWAKVTSAHRVLALDLLGDITRRSKFEAGELAKERKVIVEEIHMSDDVPSEQVHLLMDQLLWPGHALGRDIAGTAETVSIIQLPEVLSYYHRCYVPNNFVVAVAGAVRHDDVIEECKRLFGDWPPGNPMTFAPAPVFARHPQVDIKYKETEQAHVCVGAEGLPRTHPDRRAQDVQNLILGGGMSSRLFLEIREKRALAYDVHSFVEHLSDTGATVVYAGTDPDQVVGCVEAILEELDRLRNDLVPEAELRKAKEYFKGRMLLGMEDSSSITSWLGAQELLNCHIQSIEDVMREIDAVQAEDVRRVARRCLHPDLLRMAVVGPFKDESPLRALVER